MISRSVITRQAPVCRLPKCSAAARFIHTPLYLMAMTLGTATLSAAESEPDSSAAEAVPNTVLQRVEVTGSAIRRVDAETAVPITILRADELRKQGVNTTAELMQRVTGSQSLINSASSVGQLTGGASFADMRGIGSNKTLVLLNGRRLANNAISSTSVDLNMIPFAAIDRVEVLRDGASALYGTDAIGGVINFITKKTMTDGQLSLGGESPTHSGGGSSKDLNASWGVG